MLQTKMEMRINSEDYVQVVLITEFVEEDGQNETLAFNELLDATSVEQANDYVKYYEERGVKVLRVTTGTYTG
ncbi:hypothetical protein CN495_08720 [Bacillus thuringiensis]|uniref:Phage protein n=1 Tax=Bacillus thuringiensis TaxID=1428 RepID=A0ABD6S7L3_BACTU|nr:hypothetical protein [Bacillus thuringiensis]PER55824.1 hypothetical protein CN495_08720 [Bacillus thuringiensis]